MAILQSFDPSLAHTTTEKFHLFPKLPVELREIIWKEAADQHGMFICGTLEPNKVSSDCSSIDHQHIDGLECGCNNHHYCACERYPHFLHSRIPALVHANRESRNLTFTTFVDFQEGRLLNTWDKYIVLADGPLPFCMRSCCYESNHFGSEWFQFQNIVYLAPGLCHGSPNISLARSYGVSLQIMFRPRAGGRCVKTITVLTPEEIKKETWDSFKRGWTDLFGNEEIFENEFPEPELVCISNMDTFLQVKSAIQKSGILYE